MKHNDTILINDVEILIYPLNENKSNYKIYIMKDDMFDQNQSYTNKILL